MNRLHLDELKNQGRWDLLFDTLATLPLAQNVEGVFHYLSAGLLAKEQRAFAFFETLLQTKSETMRFMLLHMAVKTHALEALQQALQHTFSEQRWKQRILDLGMQLFLEHKYERAEPLLKAALRYFPENALLYLRLGQITVDRGEVEVGRGYFSQALERVPVGSDKYKHYKLLSIFAIPHIHASKASQQATLERVEKELEAFSAQGTMSQIVFPNLSFLLAYDDYDMRPIMEKIGRLWKVPPRIALPGKGKKYKVGFVSEFFYHHSVSHCYGGFVKALCEHPDFEVTLFHTGKIHDETTASYQEMAHNLVVMEDINEISAQVSGLGADALIYLDIGMSQVNYQLACQRLAPIQITFAGHPVTTGIPNMDYYMKGEVSLPENAQNHFSEQLVLVHNIVAYQKPVLPETLKSKAELGLDENANNYICPMTLFKVHPDFDFAVAEILRRDPKGKVYFFEQGKIWGEQLRARFEREIPDVVERIVFLPWAPKADFLQILALADVVLDTFYFGAGNTGYLSFGVGTPIVTLPARYTRGRHAYAQWLILGLEDGIAASVEDYVARANKIATDKAYQSTLRKQILQCNETLFGRRTDLSDVFQWLKETIEDKRSAARK